MIPELGRYVLPVLAAYGVAFVLLGGLVLASLLRGAQVRRALERAEAGRAGGGGRDGL